MEISNKGKCCFKETWRMISTSQGTKRRHHLPRRKGSDITTDPIIVKMTKNDKNDSM